MPSELLWPSTVGRLAKIQVVTIVQLKHRTSSSATGASPDLNEASTSSAARAEGITFDQASSVVKFTAKDISRCVHAFLEQWERLSKVIMVAGDGELLESGQMIVPKLTFSQSPEQAICVPRPSHAVFRFADSDFLLLAGVQRLHHLQLHLGFVRMYLCSIIARQYPRYSCYHVGRR
jgi:hypothetical protein